MVLAARGTSRSGFSDSAAPTETFSTPPKEKTAMHAAARIPVTPLGAKPPWAVRFVRPVAGLPGRPKKTITAPMTMKTTIAVTVTMENQYSLLP